MISFSISAYFNVLVPVWTLITSSSSGTKRIGSRLRISRIRRFQRFRSVASLTTFLLMMIFQGRALRGPRLGARQIVKCAPLRPLCFGFSSEGTAKGRLVRLGGNESLPTFLSSPLENSSSSRLSRAVEKTVPSLSSPFGRLISSLHGGDYKTGPGL